MSEKNIKELLRNENFVGKLRTTFGVLKIVCEGKKGDENEKKPVTPTDIVKKLYKKKFTDHLTEKEKNRIIRGSRPVISRKLSTLQSELKLVYEGEPLEDSRSGNYLLTDRGLQIMEYISKHPEEGARIFERRKKVLKEKTVSPFAREFHSKQLREVIKKLLDELQTISSTDSYTPSIISPKSYYDGDDLNVETTEVLFDDLKNHLKFCDKPFDVMLSRFKQMCKEFCSMKNKVLKGISLDVANNFGFNMSEYCEVNTFTTYLPEWIYKASFCLSIDKKYYKGYYLNFKSKIEEEKTKEGIEVIEYWVGAYGFMKVAKEKRDKEKFQKEMDKKLRTYIRKENLSKAPYYRDVVQCTKLSQSIEELREEIIKILKKNLMVPIFDGNCKYLSS